MWYIATHTFAQTPQKRGKTKENAMTINDLLTWYFNLPDWAMFAIAIPVVIIFTLLWKAIFRDQPRAPRAWNPAEQSAIDAAFKFMWVENIVNAGKALIKQRAENGFYLSPLIVPVGMFGCIVLVVIVTIFQKEVMPESHNILTASQYERCLRSVGDGSWFDLQGDEALQNGDYCDGQTIVIETPVAIEPTTVIEQASPTAFVPEQQAVVVEETQVVYPTSSGTQYFSVWVKYMGVYGKSGYWGSVPVENVTAYQTIIDNAPCGEPTLLPDAYPDVIALVQTNETVYGAEVTTDGSSITVMCAGTVDFVVLP